MEKDLSIKYTQLDNQNFEDFFYLLKRRGEKDKNYFRWKYLTQPYKDRHRGFIAYKDDSPIGCIGIINRQIQNDSNEKQYATWFADWFVIKEAQGLGIGKTLIKNVFDLSDKAFGIAGPLPAKKIAKMCGYNNLNGYYNIIIPLNVIKCGIKRFSGGIHKKLFRILNLFYIHFFKKIIDPSKNYKMKFEKPSLNSWYDSSNNCMNKKNRLFRQDKLYLKWLLEMPKKDNIDFNWWHINNDEFFASGLIEKDIWGLISINILDLIIFDKNVGYRSLLNTFKKNKIDIVKYSKIMFDMNDSPYHKYFVDQLPLFTKSKINPGDVFISNLDRENIWKDLPR